MGSTTAPQSQIPTGGVLNSFYINLITLVKSYNSLAIFRQNGLRKLRYSMLPAKFARQTTWAPNFILYKSLNIIRICNSRLSPQGPTSTPLPARLTIFGRTHMTESPSQWYAPINCYCCNQRSLFLRLWNNSVQQFDYLTGIAFWMQ